MGGLSAPSRHFQFTTATPLWHLKGQFFFVFSESNKIKLVTDICREINVSNTKAVTGRQKCVTFMHTKSFWAAFYLPWNDCDCLKTTHSDVIIMEITAKMRIMQIRVIKRTLITRTGSNTRCIHIHIKWEINPAKLALTLTRLCDL